MTNTVAIKTLPMTQADLDVINKMKAKSSNNIPYIAFGGYAFSFVMMVFVDISLLNISLFLLLPFTLFVAWMIYRRINDFSRDNKEKLKEQIIIKVASMKRLSDRDIADFHGALDHVMTFEENPFKMDERHFTSRLHPDYLEAKFFLVEESKYYRAPLKMEPLNDNNPVQNDSL